MVVAVSNVGLTATAKPSRPLTLRERVLETAKLTDRRGYGVSLPEFSRLLYGGSAPEAAVAAEVARTGDLVLADGLVIRKDRIAAVAEMLARRASHARNAKEAEAYAHDFAARLVSSCPLVRSVSLTGSMASGGFDPADDVDVNIVARDGAKYTVYLWALALSALTSVRNLGKPTDEMSALPFLPKIICVNVVWEESQARPFQRQDKWLAYELLMHRPILGAQAWKEIIGANGWLQDHFPQVMEPGFVGKDAEAAIRLARARRAGRGLFESLERHPRALALVEGLARTAVIALHKLVSLSRAHTAAAREREAFVNLVKRPYSVFDIPGREAAVPTAALEARGEW